MPIQTEIFQYLLNAEGIIIPLILQIFFDFLCFDSDISGRINTGIPTFDQLVFAELVCSFFGDRNAFLQFIEQDDVILNSSKNNLYTMLCFG